MFTEKYIIKYQGCNPTEETRLHIENKLHEIISEFPQSTTINLVLSKKEETYKGVFTIHLPRGRFIAIAQDEKLELILSKLQKRIRKHLSRYKVPRLHRRSSVIDFIGNERVLQNAG